MEKTNTFVPAIRIPVGISNFREIREKDLYYVDKTGFIFELLNSTRITGFPCSVIPFII